MAMKDPDEDEIQVYGEASSYQLNEETGEWDEVGPINDPFLAAIEEQILKQVNSQRRSRKGGYDQ